PSLYGLFHDQLQRATQRQIPGGYQIQDGDDCLFWVHHGCLIEVSVMSFSSSWYKMSVQRVCRLPGPAALFAALPPQILITAMPWAAASNRFWLTAAKAPKMAEAVQPIPVTLAINSAPFLIRMSC